MRTRLVTQLAVVAASLAALVVAPGSTAHSTVLRGFGTALIDGAFGAGEWNAAAHSDFMVRRSSAEGGGTVPATLYLMNDAQNLYVGLKVASATVGSSQFFMHFDRNHDGNELEEGNDTVGLTNSGFVDQFTHQLSPGVWTWSDDEDFGGTWDGFGLDGDHAGYSFYELMHPLDTADDAHDFTVALARRVGFHLRFLHCIRSTCASSDFPPDHRGDIVTLSGTSVPPDTELTTGPADGATIDVNPEYGFSGSDDIAPVSELTYQCAVDGGEWTACTSPTTPAYDDGRHTFAVRALDEMLNADPTPAERRWRLDTTPPSAPRVAGPRRTASSAPVYRFSARDATTPPARIRFRCSFDTRRLHPCAARYSRRLGRGRHTLRVEALDSFGSRSRPTTVRIVVRPK